MTSYIESAAGEREGGRTGLTAAVVALLSLIAAIFAPLVAPWIPVQATAPVPIIVGLLMMGEVINIRFDDFTEALPAFSTIIMMPLTYPLPRPWPSASCPHHHQVDHRATGKTMP